MSKTSRKWLVAGAVIAIVATVVFFYLDDWAEAKLKTVLQEKIEKPNRLEYSGLEVSVFAGSLALQNVSATWLLKNQARQVEVVTPEIRLKGIDWLELIFSKKMNIRALSIESPFVTMSNIDSTDTTDSTEYVATADAPPKEGLKSLDIGKISIHHGQIRVLKNAADTVAGMEVDTFNVELGGLSMLLGEKGQPLQVASASADLHNLFFRSNEGLNDISLRSFSFNKKDSLILANGLKVIPKYGKRELSAKLKYKQSWLEMEFPTVKMTGWQYDKMMDGQLVARTALVENIKINVFTDRNLPLDPNSDKPFPQESLLAAGIGITFDSVVARGGRLNYENLGDDRSTPGKIVFTALQGVFTNITNDSARIRKNPTLEIRVEGNFQQKHRVTQHMWMDLSSPSHVFTYEGTVVDVPFTELNAFLAPAHGIALERGVIKTLDFRINADKKVAKGDLKLQYEDLGIALLNEKNEKKKIMSGIVSLLFIDKENQHGEKGFQQGEVHAVRIPQRSFFHFWWNGIQSGLVSSILSAKTVERMKKSAEKKKRKK